MKYLKIFEDYLDDQPSVNVESDNKASVKRIIDLHNNFDNYHKFINAISDKLNVKIVKLMNYGTQGVAIELTDNKVMKLTRDLDETINAFNLINKNTKHLVKIHSVHVLNIWKEEPIGIIIMEKVEKNDDLIKIMSAVHIVIQELKHISEEDVISDISDVIDDMYSRELISKFIKIQPQLVEIYLELNKLNLPTGEAIVGDNLGYDKNGILKVFDIGYETKFDIHINEIPQLEI